MTDYSRAIRQPGLPARAARAAFQPFEQRRSELDRHNAVAIGNHRVTGFITVINAGEVAVDVPFPIWFVEKPAFSFGAELAEGFSAEALNMPTCSVVVLRWNTILRNGATYWIGANVAIVTTGQEDHQMIVHWHMEGKAFVNPVMSTNDTDATI